MEKSSKECRCKHGGSPWIVDGNQGNMHQSNNTDQQLQVKPYPVQGSYFNGSLTHQPGIPFSPAQFQPSNFHEAVGRLAPAAIEQLLLSDPSLIHEKGFNGQLPLHQASLRGDPAIVALLLRFKADPNAPNDFHETPLHFACKRANLPLLHSLIESGGNLDAEDRAGKGALHHAAHGGSVLMIHYLLEACNLSPFVCDRNISTPMHIICMHGHREAFSYFLKKERCDPFSKDAQGNTLLHVAASNGNIWMCSCLLEHGGYRLLREVNGEGCTALDLAKLGSQEKYKEIVRLLSYYSQRPDKAGPIRGPLLAWYGLLLLPFAILPAALFVASFFNNKGPVTLAGVLMLLAMRFLHSHRMNHVTRWPSPAHAGIFLAGMFYTSCCYYFLLLPYFYFDHIFLVIGSLLLSMSMIYLYGILITRDPGSVKISMERPGSESLYSIVDVATNHLKPDRFCTVCEVIPPALSSHCRLCEKCYVHVDHHCLYLYRCVASGNLRVFVFFIGVILMSMIVFLYGCFLYVVCIYPEHPFDFDLILLIFASEPFVWSLSVLNAFTIVWCVWLLRMQLLTITKGRVLAYQSYHSKSHLTAKQRAMNLLHFVLNKEPFARDVICSA